jgi:uncharacterized membrane protein
MLDIILAVIVAVFVKFTLVHIGGFIRWVIFRKKSLKEYVNDDWEGNLAAFLLTVALVAVLLVIFTR